MCSSAAVEDVFDTSASTPISGLFKISVENNSRATALQTWYAKPFLCARGLLLTDWNFKAWPDHPEAVSGPDPDRCLCVLLHGPLRDLAQGSMGQASCPDGWLHPVLAAMYACGARLHPGMLALTMTLPAMLKLS